MKAILFATLVVATSTAALAAGTPQSPEKAAALALKQCVDHALGTSQIKGQNGQELDSRGLAYQRDAPQFLSSTQQTDLGRAEYVKAPSTDGEIWSVGYDGGSCMVVTMATVVPPIEKSYVDYFGSVSTWHAERPPSGNKGERKLQYTMMPTRASKLTATVSLRDDEGISSIVIRRQTR
jgi:hypothetical protein